MLHSSCALLRPPVRLTHFYFSVDKLSLLGRMPTNAHPLAARLHQLVSVQLERRDRRAPGGCQAKDPISRWSPDKMLEPLLLSRMEQWHHLAGLRVRCLHPVALVFVATRAG